MALRGNGTANSFVSRLAVMPNWGAFTFTLFFRPIVDRNTYSCIIQVGAGGVYSNQHFVMSLNADGTELVFYNDATGTLVSLGQTVVGRLYGLAIRSTSGTNVTIHLLDTTTGAVTTANAVPSFGTGALTGFRLFNNQYNEVFNGRIFGLKFWSAALTESESVRELQTMIPQTLTSNLIGWYPMFSTTKALCYVDVTKNQDLAETGTALTQEVGGGVPWGAAPLFMPSTAPALSREQEGFRFFADDGTEATATALAVQDANVSSPLSSPFRLRMLVNAVGDHPSTAYKLQYRKVGDATWLDVK